MTQCNVAGCNRASATYSRMCDYHRKRTRNHGHPEQTALRKPELKPYAKAVRKYLSERSKVDPAPITKKAWEATVTRCKQEMNAYERGKAGPAHHREACGTILNIDYNSDHSEVAETMMAMGYFLEDQPKRFKSDDAFVFQCVRMLRKLAPITAQHVYGSDGKIIRSRYPETGKRTVWELWEFIKDIEFVGWGIAMAKSDQKYRESQQRDKLAERAAILGGI